MGNRSLRQDAVPEIEDERPLGEGLEHRIDSRDRAPRRRKPAPTGRGCPGPACATGFGCARRARSTVQSSPIASTGTSSTYRSSAVPTPRGNPMIFATGTSCANLRDDALRRLDAPASEFLGREHACPGVENLHGIDACLQLADQIACRGVDQLVDQRRKTIGVAHRRTAVPALGPACRGRQSCSLRPSTAPRRSPTVRSADRG